MLALAVKPCPFCGQPPIVEDLYDEGWDGENCTIDHWWEIRCKKCRIKMTNYDMGLDELIAMWNNRHEAT